MRRALLVTLVLALTAPAAADAAAPRGVTGLAGNARVELAWQAELGASAYQVYRGTSPTAITTRLTPSVGTTATTFTDATAVNGTTYFYAVRSVEGGAETGNSLVVEAMPRAPSCTTGNAVVRENCFPGDPGWKVLNTLDVFAGGIEGFATATSLDNGASVDLKVNSSASSTFRLEIYRSGSYGGTGARLVSAVRSVPGRAQPACATDSPTGLVDCSNWAVSATISTTANWPSGVYLARLVRDNGTDTHVLFVVRDDARAAEVVYGVAFTDFQAYNDWGGKSLYDFNSAGNITVAGTARAVKVSFDRPFRQARNPGLRDWYTRIEFAMVSWLEAAGYDVAYISNTDLETDPARIRTAQAYVSPAHDEYYSSGMRTALEQARDAGVGLFFTGSNEVYWRIRFENGGRVQVCYKSTQSGGADPSGIHTGTWRDPAGVNNPENALTGVMYVGDADATYFPLEISAAEGKDRVYRYTDLPLQPNGTSTRIGSDLVGWEWDARVANGREPAGLTTLASSLVTGQLIQGNGAFQTPGSTTSHMVKYTAASGALVVTTGTNHWARGLARNVDNDGTPDLRIQQATTNILADMGARPATPGAGIVLDDALGRPPAPALVSGNPQSTTSLTVAWTGVSGATGYNVYRSSTPRTGGVPLGTKANTALVGSTSFTDTGLTASTTYYYVVTAVVTGTESGPSPEVQVTTLSVNPPPGGTTVRINAGGPAYTAADGRAFSADTSFTGGSTWITTSSISGTIDPALYQNERWGQFSYALPVTNGAYDIRFHFAELYYGVDAPGGAGKRVFGMDVLDSPASPDLANIDIYAAVGARTALVRTVSGVEVNDGVLNIRSVYGAADDPEVTAIEVIPVAAGPSDTTPPTVSISSPADGATVNSTISVTATAGDNVGVSGVQFQLDGQPLGAEDTTAPYAVSWNTGTASNGDHNLTAVARDAASNRTTSASVRVNVQNVAPPPPPSGGTTVRINAGGPAYTSSSGQAFSADASFTGGQTWTVTDSIAGTSDPALYQNERWGQFSYAVPVQSGTYDVRFHFAELYYGTAVPGGAGKRVFGMDILDTPPSPDINNLDIYASVGARTALVRTITGVSVSDGVLDIRSVYGPVDDPEVTAIEIIPSGAPPPDTSPPTVAITAPTAGETVSGPVSVIASASDDRGVAAVQFRLDDVDLGAEDTTAPYSIDWDTLTATAGPHTLTAVARDAAGNRTTSADVPVVVDNTASDTTPPTVAITAPAAGALVSGLVTVEASASDAGGIGGVQLRVDGADVGAEDTAAPYSIGWDTATAADGEHDLTVVARDVAGNRTTSAAVRLTVQNGPAGGLVAAYAFSEGSGTAVADASGRGNIGTIVGATWTTAGMFGSALNFDGDDWVTVADSPSLDLTSAMTVSAWVNPTSIGSLWSTVLLKETAANLVYALYSNTDTNRPSGHVFAGSDLDTPGTAQLPFNAWTHLAATWDGATLRLYVNGTQVSSRAVTGTMTPSTGPLRIGGNGVWGEYFRGRIDEVRVYDRALSAAEVQADQNRAVGT